jgi:hypothetical protein
VILVVLLLYRPATTIPGVILVVLGVPVYFLFRMRMRRDRHAAQRIAELLEQ